MPALSVAQMLSKESTLQESISTSTRALQTAKANNNIRQLRIHLKKLRVQINELEELTNIRLGKLSGSEKTEEQDKWITFYNQSEDTYHDHLDHVNSLDTGQDNAPKDMEVTPSRTQLPPRLRISKPC